MATIGNLIVKISADAKGIEATLGGVTKSLRDVDAAVDGAGGGFSKFQAGLVSLDSALNLVQRAWGPLKAGVSAVVQATIEAERANKLLESQLKATGGTAGFTIEQLDAMASSFQKATTTGDEEIKGLQATLLSFRNITGDVFEKTIKASLDFAEVTGRAAPDALNTLAKALNNPTSGMAALRKAGISLSDSTKQLVKDLEAQGKTADAQKVLLAELEKSYGGAAEAARDTLGGSIKALQNAFGDLLEAPTGSISSVTGGINQLTTTLEDPAFKQFASETLGAIASGLAKAAESAINAGKTIGGFIDNTLNSSTRAKEAMDRLNVALAHAKNHGIALSLAQQEAILAGKSLAEVTGTVAKTMETAGKAGAVAGAAIADGQKLAAVATVETTKAALEQEKAWDAIVKQGADIIAARKKQRAEEAAAAEEAKKNAEVVLDSLEKSSKAIQDSMDRALQSSLGAAGTNIEIFGEVANSFELASIEADFMRQAIDALNSGSLSELNSLLAAGQNYLHQFEEGIQLVTGKTSIVAGVVGALDRALLHAGTTTRGATNDILRLNDALRVFTNNQLAARAAIDGTTGELAEQTAAISAWRTASGATVAETLEQDLAEATRVLKTWSSSAASTATISVQASGSPTLPFSDYFTKYIPKVLEDATRGVPSLTFPTAFDGAGADGGLGGGDLADEIALLREDLQGLLKENTRVTAAGARETTNAIGSPGFAAKTSAALDVISRVTRGTR